MNKSCLRSTLALLTLVAASALGGCSDASKPSANVGGVQVDLALGGGENINTASYSITGPAGFMKSGMFDISNSTALTVAIGGLPAGNGYTITVTATTPDTTISCNGTATFNVTTGMTTMVTVHLTCHQAPRNGSVLVNGTLNICPQIDSISALPTNAIVGTGISVTSAAHDSDGGPSPLTYAWSATSGVFDNPASPNALFTCTTPGPVTITLIASDGDPDPNCPDNLQVQVTCVAPPPRPYAWVVLASGGQPIARVVTPDTTCPSISINGVAQAMNLRIGPATVPVRTSSATPVLASAFPVTACELPIPAGTFSAVVLGQNLPLPKTSPSRIVILGDTGCRLKTGNPWQACSDETQWPFQRIADKAASMHPDLVLHVGDYHYRENQCPVGITGCQGSPWSYGWDAWEADLFRPGASLMAAAPWVMVRGNHEECLRAGQGWFRFLDTRPYAEVHSCNDPTNDSIANFDDPYAVPVGSDTQIIVFDTAKAGAAALNPMNATDAPIFNTFQAELQLAAGLVQPNRLNIWANHHPLLAYTPATTGNPTGGILSMLSVMQATFPGSYYPPGIGVAFHGHVHDFQAIDFSTPHPPTFVAGIGGDNLDAQLPDPFPFSVQPAAGVMADAIAHTSAFGFMTMDRVAGSWTFSAYRVDGTLMTTCSMLAGDKISCSATGFLH
jgi:hypothetical protein